MSVEAVQLSALALVWSVFVALDLTGRPNPLGLTVVWALSVCVASLASVALVGAFYRALTE